MISPLETLLIRINIFLFRYFHQEMRHEVTKKSWILEEDFYFGYYTVALSKVLVISTQLLPVIQNFYQYCISLLLRLENFAFE